MEAKQRPTGITILAVLALVGGVFYLLSALASGFLGGGLAATFVGTGVGGLFALLGIVALVLGIAYLAFAYGAWTLKPWGWILGVAIAVVGLALSLVYVLQGDAITNQLISVVVDIIILYYLNTPDVKKAFGRA